MPTIQTIVESRMTDQRPLLTWHGDGGERVEISARVMSNWSVKTANLLVEEFDAGPGFVLACDLPTHWRTVALALGCWLVGGTFDVADDHTGVTADLLATEDPATAPRSSPSPAPRLVVALPALAMRHPGPLATGDVDYAATVAGMPDALVWPQTPEASDPAARTAHAVLSYGELLGSTAVDAFDGRLQLTTAAPLRAARTVLAALAGDGAVILTRPDIHTDTATLAAELPDSVAPADSAPDGP